MTIRKPLRDAWHRSSDLPTLLELGCGPEDLFSISTLVLYHLDLWAAEFCELLSRCEEGFENGGLPTLLPEIYTAKQTYLDLLVRAGCATVQHFVNPWAGRGCWHCIADDLSLGQWNGSCYDCDESQADEGSIGDALFYVVDGEGFRFTISARGATCAMRVVSTPKTSPEPMQARWDKRMADGSVEAGLSTMNAAIERLYTFMEDREAGKGLRDLQLAATRSHDSQSSDERPSQRRPSREPPN